MVRKPEFTGTLGFQRFFQDLLHRRWRHRQFVGLVFLFLLVAFAEPYRAPRLFAPGATLALLGILVRLWASGHVKKDKELATTGPYALVRHPLYVGNQLILVGFCLASALWWSALGWAVISLLFYPPAIRHEDEVLHRLFGADWERWRAHTFALVPRWPEQGTKVFGRWSFTQSLKANGEPLIAALLLFFLYLIWLRLT
jgi:protein-S-isoprenylcysteine O-methyltransferase Ste14